MHELNLDKNSKYLLACSYGPDSMALFHLLVSQGYNFDCAIVNYHIRKESNSEVEGLLNYASNYKVKVHVKDCGYSLSNLSEAKCREIRYAFFSKLCDQNGYDAVLVAHHQDDKIETYLIQKQRQNCPIYYGIKEKTIIKGVEVIRPLLSYSKKELTDICEKNRVPFSIDKTNFDISILRNHIRHDIVAKMSDQERADVLNKINEENSRLSELIGSIDLTKIHNVGYLLSIDELTLKYALNILAKYISDNQYLSKENVGEILKALKSKKPNIVFKIKRGLYFIKEYTYVDITNENPVVIKYSYVLDKPGILDTPFFHLDFSKNSDGRNVTSQDYPLTIRNAELDDYIFINGYKVLVRRLFIDWKMPIRLRVRWPIILDRNNEPLYVPRYQKDFVLTKNCNFYVKK